MPGSEKVLKNRERALNRANGIGDKDGKMTHNNKKAEVNLKCTQCAAEIRATKRNVEAGQHASQRHPDKHYNECFVGADLPEGHADLTAGASKGTADKAKKLDVDKIRAEAAARKHLEEGGIDPAVKAAEKAAAEAGGAVVTKKKKKKEEDLSFLDDAVAAGKKGKGGKK
jgi:hypothetical protein